MYKYKIKQEIWVFYSLHILNIHERIPKKIDTNHVMIRDHATKIYIERVEGVPILLYPIPIYEQ